MPGQHSGANQGKSPGGSEDRIDEPDVQHATAGIFAQAAICLLYRLIGQKPAEGGGKRRIERKNEVAEPGNDQSVRRNDAAASVVVPMAPSEPINRGALDKAAFLSI